MAVLRHFGNLPSFKLLLIMLRRGGRCTSNVFFSRLVGSGSRRQPLSGQERIVF